MAFWDFLKSKKAPASGLGPLERVPGIGAGYPRVPPAGDDASASILFTDPGYYTYHPGDLFTPGMPQWALNPVYDTPINPIWGTGTMRNPWAFSPVQPPPMYVAQALTTNVPRGTIYQGIDPNRLYPIDGAPGPLGSFNG